MAVKLINSPQKYPISLDIARSWLGYDCDRLFRNKLIDRFSRSRDYEIFSEKIWLSVDAFKNFAATSGTKKSIQVSNYFQNCN